ncbi:hypothetical protein SAY86_005174 [Trapa natans]|uniref:Uncharacterized protein n=1 Tax=Trapa natans TaxID=22666 RepID=A0AAN7L0B5_TRANT|nr:hypothetical protein SAY86_005174 [Trapa natans]
MGVGVITVCLGDHLSNSFTSKPHTIMHSTKQGEAVVARRCEKQDQTSESRSQEERLGDLVSRVLKETELEFSLSILLITKPALSVCSPSGHPPSACHSIKHPSVRLMNTHIDTSIKGKGHRPVHPSASVTLIRPLEERYTEKRVVRSGIFFWRA